MFFQVCWNLGKKKLWKIIKKKKKYIVIILLILTKIFGNFSIIILTSLSRRTSNRSSSKKKNNSSGVLKLCWSFAATLTSLSKFMYESLSKRKKSFNVLE